MGDEGLERMPWVLEMDLEMVNLGGEKVESRGELRREWMFSN
jgi:hypothetical protein